MPVIKLPVVHKFGIISHSQRLELQERLLREAYAKSVEGKASFISTKLVLSKCKRLALMAIKSKSFCC